jgi:hypothetical protein
MNATASIQKGTIGDPNHKISKARQCLRDVKRVTGLSQAKIAAFGLTARSVIASWSCGRRSLSSEVAHALERSTGIDHRNLMSGQPLTVCPAFQEVLKLDDPSRQDWSYRKKDFELFTTHRNTFMPIIVGVLCLQSMHLTLCLLAAISGARAATLKKIWEVDYALHKALEGVKDECQLRPRFVKMQSHPLMSDLEVGLSRQLDAAFGKAFNGSNRENAKNSLANLLLFCVQNGTALHPFVGRSPKA